MGKISDLKGKIFGRLTVIKYEGLGKYNKAQWLCLCECGNSCVVTANSLVSGHTKSCGCLHDEKAKINRLKHGLRHHPLYSKWLMMKERCYNPRDSHYKYYGGKGIGLCDDWKNSFKSFYDWAINNGWKRGLSIERIDNNKQYEQENCKWIPMCKQAQNKTTNHYVADKNGNVYTIAEISRKTNINVHTLYACYNKHKSILPTLYLRGIYDYVELDDQK